MPPLTTDQALALAAEHYHAGRLRDTEVLCRQILQASPRHVDAMNLLAAVAYAVGQGAAAASLLEQAIAIDPARADLFNNLGEALRSLAREDDAIAAYRQALALDPAYASALSNLAIILAQTGRAAEAEADLRRAIQHHPTFAEAHNNLGNVLLSQGRVDEALAAHRAAVDLQPDYAQAHSSLLRDLSYDESIAPLELLEEHRQWWRQHRPASVASSSTGHANTRDADRALRVGLVSPDFRRHPVAHFIEPLLAGHDRTRMQILCYAELSRADEVTARLRGLSDGWFDTFAQTDETVAEQIRRDRIDILIDLAGHTAGNRIELFALRPAPIQMTYLGYPCTTGCDAIDYRITDAHADPFGMTESHHSEKLLRLPRTAWCYRPPTDAPHVADTPPMDRNGFVTFGGFHFLAKLSPAVIASWSAILTTLPNSRLLLKSSALADEAARRRLLDSFAAAGAPADRISLAGRDASITDHLSRYHEIDIALDTFPYCGTTTTCEALWMGVPVVTLSGRSSMSRVGASLLRNLNLEELIADTRQHYAATAVGLATDAGRLRALRCELRPRMEQSPLRDEIGFAREFEQIIRAEWRRVGEQP